VVRKFVHLLETGDGDIMQEAELLRLRQEVVTTIRSNRQLEADLDLMDLKIGLLVRNRLTLQVYNTVYIMYTRCSGAFWACLSHCVCVCVCRRWSLTARS